MIGRFVILGVACLLLQACAGLPASPLRDEDAALFEWQDEALSLIGKYQLNPLRASRMLAALHMGMLSVSNGTAGQPDVCRVSQIDAAAADILEYFFPLETPGRFAAHARRHRQPALQCDFAAAQQAVAAAKQRARTDGAFPPRKLRSNAQPFAGEWRPTWPLFSNTPTEPYAGEWRMYFADSPAVYELLGPLDPASAAYVEATRLVLDMQQRLTANELRLAEMWNLDAGSITPPGVWNLRLRELLQRPGQAKPLRDNARLFAVLNTAMYDAMVSCWHFKFTYWTERPLTAADRLGLGNLKPVLVTPAFPAYPSGHATVSGAAERVISVYVPALASEASRLANEAANSRLWGGIHFAFDNTDGLMLGRQVGDAAVRALPPEPRPIR